MGGSAGVSLHAHLLPIVLLLISIALAFLYWATGRIRDAYGTAIPPGLEALVWFFDLNDESNAPAWFSAVLWLFAGLLALGARGQSERLYDRRRWASLAALFAFLSLDEAGSLHEEVGHALSGLIDSAGPFYLWMIYGVVFLAVVAAFYARFVLSLPRGVLWRIVCAAIVFLAGALGMEAIGAAVENGAMAFPVGLTWRRVIALEELLEMWGVILLIHAQLLFLRDNAPSGAFGFRVGPRPVHATTFHGSAATASE